MTTALVLLSATLMASLAIALILWHRGPQLIAVALTMLLVVGGVILKRLDGGVGSWLSYSAFLALPVVSAIALLFGLSRQRRPSALHVVLAVGLASLLVPFAIALSVVWGEGL
jgi:hypothetical protein